MKLAEIVKLVKADPTLKHARKSWGGKAYLRGIEDHGLWIFCAEADVSARFGHNFDDMMAEDWEVMP